MTVENMAVPDDCCNCYLIVKRFSKELTNDEKADFLKHFGGKDIKCFPKNCPLGNTALAKFETSNAAQKALQKLHQLDLLGKRLVAEYASKDIIERANKEESRIVLEKSSNLGHSKFKPTKDTTDKDKGDDDDINPYNNQISVKHGVQNEFPKHLCYFYPPPTVTILTNIANAMASVPKFYTQVLHLMNKMNLPPPFSALTVTPPLPGDSINLKHVGVDTSDLAEFFMSSSESELESEGEQQQSTTEQTHVSASRKQRDIRTEAIRKGKRALKLAKADQLHGATKRSRQDTHIPNVPVSEAFEQQNTTTARIEFKLNATIASQFQAVVYNQSNINEQDQTLPPILQDTVQKHNPVDSASSHGFGVIEPPVVAAKDAVVSDDSEEETDLSERQWISRAELRRHRLSREELAALPQIKSYERGEKTSRLYIKNLAKQTEEKDLHYIFRRFAGMDSSDESFDIRLMKEGRMKGQAFISFSTPEIAEKALLATHGFVLKEKPMIVSFARSSKPKE